MSKSTSKAIAVSGGREWGCNVQHLIPADHYYGEITRMALHSAVPANVSARS